MAHKQPTNKDYRKFGLFLAALFLLAAFAPLIRRGEVRWWALAVGAALLLVAIAFPVALKPVFKASLKVGGVLGWINTRILLSVLFYLIFTPVGFVLRITRGKDGRWTQRAQRTSYWHTRDAVDAQHQMRHLF